MWSILEYPQSPSRQHGKTSSFGWMECDHRKPLTSTLREGEELAELARKQRLFLYEAITTIYQPDYAALKAQLYRIGTVELVSCNFSQYSSRYEAFRRGKIHPVFDPEKSGGALMDLNLYNLHWMLGLFGTPEQVEYYANMEHGIDTSGVLLLQYPDFQAVILATKDCAAPSRYIIQGTEAIYCRTPLPISAAR